MGRIRREPWRYSSNWGTVIDLSGCQFGLEMDGRCHTLYCLFRCDITEQPKKKVKIGQLLCPKEMSYESKQPNEAKPISHPKVV